MHVREASPADASAVRNVAEAAWHDAHDDIVGPEAVDEFLAEYYDPEDLAERYHDADSTTFVATVEGRIVAYASGVPEEDAYTLGSIYVHPDHQGEGIGSELLAHVEDAARDAGYETLRLVVMTDNDDAIAFYEARGFERVDDHYDPDLDVENDVYEKAVEE